MEQLASPLSYRSSHPNVHFGNYPKTMRTFLCGGKKLNAFLPREHISQIGPGGIRHESRRLGWNGGHTAYGKRPGQASDPTLEFTERTLRNLFSSEKSRNMIHPKKLM